MDFAIDQKCHVSIFANKYLSMERVAAQWYLETDLTLFKFMGFAKQLVINQLIFQLIVTFGLYNSIQSLEKNKVKITRLFQIDLLKSFTRNLFFFLIW